MLTVWLVVAPKHGGDGYHPETAALRSIQTIHAAEVQYSSQYGGFATTLAELGPPASGAPSEAAADLIDGDLASGTFQGYRYIVTGSPNGYTLLALPNGARGGKSFYSDQTMVIRESEGTEPATVNSKEIGRR